MPFLALDEVAPVAVDWLMPGRLARGHVHLLDGDPGLGKSLVLLDLAARMTTGREFPDGAPGVAPTTAVILNGEDAADDTILPRLLAAGADPSRVRVWRRDPGEAALRIPTDMAQLAALVNSTGAGLLILDPLLAFLDPAVNIGSDPCVRQALAPLAELARQSRCTIVMVRHLNKQGGGQALYRGLASIAFVAACRIAWLIGPDPRVPRRYVLAQLKNNLEPPPLSTTYRIFAVGTAAVPRIEWLGLSVWRDADLLAPPARQRRRLQRERAHDFLAAFLRYGPRSFRELIAAAETLRLHPRTLRRAAGELGVQMQQVGVGQPEQTTYWHLPGWEPKEGEG
jgi:hypothetical protein